jgi:site-specific DNA-methyltransferase (adenine-specific)
METNKIYQQDCIEGFKALPNESVDLIFADPWYYPENQKTKNAFENDVFWEITEKWLKECLRVIKKTGHIFISFSSQKMAKFEFLLANLSAPLRSRIVWHYRNAGGRCADKGAFGKTYEMIYHFGFGSELNFPDKWGEERFDVWTISIPQSNYKDKKFHPFQKPLALLKRVVELGSREGEIVLDPFMGSGTTAVASKMLNRKFIGFEIDPQWIKIAENRLSETPSHKTLIATQSTLTSQRDLISVKEEFQK